MVCGLGGRLFCCLRVNEICQEIYDGYQYTPDFLRSATGRFDCFCHTKSFFRMDFLVDLIFKQQCFFHQKMV